MLKRRKKDYGLISYYSLQNLRILIKLREIAMLSNPVRKSDSQSDSQSVSQSESQTVSQTVRKSFRKSDSQSDRRSDRRTGRQAGRQAGSQSVSETFRQGISQSVGQSVPYAPSFLLTCSYVSCQRSNWLQDGIPRYHLLLQSVNTND